MIELSVIRDLVAIFGVIAGFSYYVLTVRNQTKERKIQNFMALLERRRTPQVYRDFFNTMQPQWEDYDEFLEKYDSGVNIEMASLRNALWSFYDGLGLMLKGNMIDAETVYSLSGVQSLLVWFKWETVIKKVREGTLGDDWMENFEYLADKMIKMRQERGKKLPTALLHPTSKLQGKYS
jgi:hypothetical protein